MEQMYTISSGAKMLGVSPNTIKSYLRDGKIMRTKIGRRTLIRESQLQLLLNDGAKSTHKSAFGAVGSATQEQTNS